VQTCVVHTGHVACSDMPMYMYMEMPSPLNSALAASTVHPPLQTPALLLPGRRTKAAVSYTLAPGSLKVPSYETTHNLHPPCQGSPYPGTTTAR
jgi:hypothetical protein